MQAQPTLATTMSNQLATESQMFIFTPRLGFAAKKLDRGSKFIRSGKSCKQNSEISRFLEFFVLLSPRVSVSSSVVNI
jgi:hypothetical protein